MSDASRSELEHKWWYNSQTGEVEQGFVSPAYFRVGPFDTREQALAAPEKLRENSEKWAREDEEEGY